MEPLYKVILWTKSYQIRENQLWSVIIYLIVNLLETFFIFTGPNDQKSQLFFVKGKVLPAVAAV